MKTKLYNRPEYSVKTLMTFIAEMRLDNVTRAQLESIIDGVIARTINETKQKKHGEHQQ